MIIHSPIISGSLTFADGASVTYPEGGVYSGSFSGSFQGEGSNLTFGGTGIVSSSAQIDELFNIDGIVSSSEQIVDVLSSVNSYTASNDTTNSTQNSRLDQLSTETGSISSEQAAQDSRLSNLEANSGSYQQTLSITDTSNVDLILSSNTLSANLKGGVVSGSAAEVRSFLNVEDGADNSPSLSLSPQIAEGTPVGYLSLSGTKNHEIALNQVNAAHEISNLTTDYVDEGSGSLYYTDTRVKTKLNSEGVISGSSQTTDILTSLNSYTASNDTDISNLQSTDSTHTSRLNQLSVETGSIASEQSAQDSRLSNLEASTGSYQGNLSVSDTSEVNLILTGNTLSAELIGGVISGSSQVFDDISGDITIASNGVATIAANSVALGTDTTGNYVGTLTAGTGITSTGATSGEGIAHSLSVDYGSSAGTAVQGNTTITLNGTSNEIDITGTAAQALGGGPSYTIGLADSISGDRTFSDNVTVTGNLTVNGTTTTVNSNTVNIGDNVLVLNSDETGTPSQNGGIEIERGTSTNSTLLWDEANDYWIAGLAGAEERIVIGAGNTDITTLGTITTGTWNGTSISTTYTDAKVTSIVAGTGISISGGTGDVTVTNSDRGSSQNIFKTVAVSGQSNIVADSNSDTLTFAAGSNVTLTTNASTDTITIASSYTDTTYSAGTGITLTGTTFSTNDSEIVHDSLSGFVGNEHINHANVSISAGTGLSGGGDITTSRTLSLSHLGLESLTDPNADRVAFWDDSAGAFAWLTMGSNLSISGTTLNATDTNTTYGVSDTTGQTGIDLTLSGTTISGVTSGLTTSSTVQFAKVGVGTAADATYELKVSGDIGATGDIVAYVSSDERLKDNIELISNPIEKVQSLRGVTWDWNDNASEAAKESPNVGVIAQEVEKVLPQLVHDRENGYKGVDYAKLTGLLIEAIKEQQKQIDDLKSKIQ